MPLVDLGARKVLDAAFEINAVKLHKIINQQCMEIAQSVHESRIREEERVKEEKRLAKKRKIKKRAGWKF